MTETEPKPEAFVILLLGSPGCGKEALADVMTVHYDFMRQHAFEASSPGRDNTNAVKTSIESTLKLGAEKGVPGYVFDRVPPALVSFLEESCESSGLKVNCTILLDTDDTLELIAALTAQGQQRGRPEEYNPLNVQAAIHDFFYAESKLLQHYENSTAFFRHPTPKPQQSMVEAAGPLVETIDKLYPNTHGALKSDMDKNWLNGVSPLDYVPQSYPFLQFVSKKEKIARVLSTMSKFAGTTERWVFPGILPAVLNDKSLTEICSPEGEGTYVVSKKSTGLSCVLLHIADEPHCYFIDTGLEVYQVKCSAEVEKMGDLLLEGELFNFHNTKGCFIAYDVLYADGGSVKDLAQEGRLDKIRSQFSSEEKTDEILKEQDWSTVTVVCKKYYGHKETPGLVAEVDSRPTLPNTPHITTSLVFTPKNVGYGAERRFEWKPAEKPTIVNLRLVSHPAGGHRLFMGRVYKGVVREVFLDMIDESYQKPAFKNLSAFDGHIMRCQLLKAHFWEMLGQVRGRSLPDVFDVSLGIQQKIPTWKLLLAIDTGVVPTSKPGLSPSSAGQASPASTSPSTGGPPQQLPSQAPSGGSSGAFSPMASPMAPSPMQQGGQMQGQMQPPLPNQPPFGFQPQNLQQPFPQQIPSPNMQGQMLPPFGSQPPMQPPMPVLNSPNMGQPPMVHHHHHHHHPHHHHHHDHHHHHQQPGFPQQAQGLLPPPGTGPLMSGPPLGVHNMQPAPGILPVPQVGPGVQIQVGSPPGAMPGPPGVMPMMPMQNQSMGPIPVSVGAPTNVGPPTTSMAPPALDPGVIPDNAILYMGATTPAAATPQQPINDPAIAQQGNASPMGPQSTPPGAKVPTARITVRDDMGSNVRAPWPNASPSTESANPDDAVTSASPSIWSQNPGAAKTDKWDASQASPANGAGRPPRSPAATRRPTVDTTPQKANLSPDDGSSSPPWARRASMEAASAKIKDKRGDKSAEEGDDLIKAATSLAVEGIGPVSSNGDPSTPSKMKSRGMAPVALVASLVMDGDDADDKMTEEPKDCLADNRFSQAFQSQLGDTPNRKLRQSPHKDQIRRSPHRDGADGGRSPWAAGSPNAPRRAFREYNNSAKLWLISEFSPDYEFSVMDLCCRRGNDIHKWDRSKATLLVGADPSSEMITEANARLKAKKQSTLKAEFFVGDCFAEGFKLPTALEGSTFDVVSCMFAIQTGFKSEESAKRMLEVVSRHLKPGGVFLGTTVDSPVFLQQLKQSPDGKKFGNSEFQVVFQGKVSDVSEKNPFGHGYKFKMSDDSEEYTEYLVLPDTFDRLARKYSLFPVRLGHQNFGKASSDITNYCAKGRNIWTRMSEKERALCQLYTTFVFRKDD